MSPKEHLLSNETLAARHRAMTAKPEVREGLLAAFNQYAWGLPSAAESPILAAAANARRQGAQEFINTFLTLADQQAPRKQPTAGKLEPEDANSHH